MVGDEGPKVRARALLCSALLCLHGSGAKVAGHGMDLWAWFAAVIGARPALEFLIGQIFVQHLAIPATLTASAPSTHSPRTSNG